MYAIFLGILLLELTSKAESSGPTLASQAAQPQQQSLPLSHAPLACEVAFSPTPSMHFTKTPLNQSADTANRLHYELTTTQDDLITLDNRVHQRVYDEGQAVPTFEHTEYFQLLMTLVDLTEKRLVEMNINYKRMGRESHDPLKEFDYFVVEAPSHSLNQPQESSAQYQNKSILNSLAAGLSKFQIQVVIDPIQNAFGGYNGQLSVAESKLYTSVSALNASSSLDSTTVHELAHFGSILVNPFKLNQKLLTIVTDNKTISKGVSYAIEFFLDELRAHTIQSLFELYLSRASSSEFNSELIARNSARLREFVVRTTQVLNPILSEIKKLQTSTALQPAQVLYSENGAAISLTDKLSVTVSAEKTIFFSIKGLGRVALIGAQISEDLLPIIKSRRNFNKGQAMKLQSSALQNTLRLEDLQNWLNQIDHAVANIELCLEQNKNRDELIRVHRDLAVLFKKESK